ncbi:MAG TPA: N-carbamoylputrescine amidase [Myxococcota bacterium]
MSGSAVGVAATQMACSWDREANVAHAEAMIREAAGRGAQIILIQELFETPYFPADQKRELFALAREADHHPVVERMQKLAAELAVVLPVSFFERANGAYYNALAIVDADGAIVGRYRKSHIPDGPGYQEKFYFNPGDTGFQAWKTRYATIGAAICWDQWFPEAARIMCLQGAELLFYPTAIGSEPQDADADTRESWQLAMRGHAVCNTVPVIASNRIGTERAECCSMTFYGSSFIADHEGRLVQEASRDRQQVLVHHFDLEQIRARRAEFGLFRDRRTELYECLLTLDGRTRRER